jgi:outer membrane protein OmpU
MSAGFAVAEVAVSGSARMGVVSTDGASTFSSRVRMTLTGSGTTDGGLAFGGSFGVHDTAGANAGTAGSTFISGAFGKISMGGLDSGDAAAVGQLASVGYTGLGSTNSINYAADGFDGAGVIGSTSRVDAGGAKVLYTYAANGLSLNVSTAQLSNTAADHTAYGVGAAYTTGDLTVAVGYGDTDITLGNIQAYTADTDGTTSGGTVAGIEVVGGFTGSVTDTSVSATYVMGATTIKAIYQDKQLDVSRAASDAAADVGAIAANTHTLSATSMGLSVAHKMDALTLTAFSVSTAIDTTLASSDATVSRYGVGAAYDLGGGASVKAGWVSVDTPAIAAGTYSSGTAVTRGAASTTSYNAFDVGVNFSF